METSTGLSDKLLGFPELPRTFSDRSDLYPVAKGSKRAKNSGAWTFHIDYDQDVRCLMSIEPNAYWFTSAHHELGHVHYDLGYSTPKVPYLLRTGANRAFHEAIGDLIGLAVSQQPYLQDVLHDGTGSTLTIQPMVTYFDPLMDWLKKENRGRQVGWA